MVATRSPPVIGRRASLIVTTSVSLGCTQNFPRTPTASVSTVLCLLPNQISVEEFLLDPAHGGGKLWGTAHNSVAGELGIGSQQELEDFVMDALPKFKLVLLTDRFDEGLMLMRNLFGWDMIDLSYAILNQTSTTTMGGKKLGAQKHRPTFDELSIEAQTKIDELTSRDRAIYEAGRAHFEQNLAPLASQVEADVAGFNSLQKIIHEYLEFNRSSPARNMYEYEDFFRYFPPASAF